MVVFFTLHPGIAVHISMGMPYGYAHFTSHEYDTACRIIAAGNSEAEKRAANPLKGKRKHWATKHPTKTLLFDGFDRFVWVIKSCQPKQTDPSSLCSHHRFRPEELRLCTVARSFFGTWIVHRLSALADESSDDLCSRHLFHNPTYEIQIFPTYEIQSCQCLQLISFNTNCFFYSNHSDQYWMNIILFFYEILVLATVMESHQICKNNAFQ